MRPCILMAASSATPLSEKEQNLYERFQKDKTVFIADMSPQELGALGKLAARKLIEKTIDTTAPEGTKKKKVWKLAEIENVT